MSRGGQRGRGGDRSTIQVLENGDYFDQATVAETFRPTMSSFQGEILFKTSLGNFVACTRLKGSPESRPTWKQLTPREATVWRTTRMPNDVTDDDKTREGNEV